MKMMMIIKCALLLFISIFSKQINAQLANTTWKGVFNIPQPTECIMQMKQDTFYVIYADGFDPDNMDLNTILETSTYKVNHDTLTIQKISGGSPCSSDIIGKYSFAIKNEVLYISVIDDECNPRAMAFPSDPLTLVRKKE